MNTKKDEVVVFCAAVMKYVNTSECEFYVLIAVEVAFVNTSEYAIHAFRVEEVVSAFTSAKNHIVLTVAANRFVNIDENDHNVMIVVETRYVNTNAAVPLALIVKAVISVSMVGFVANVNHVEVDIFVSIIAIDQYVPTVKEVKFVIMESEEADADIAHHQSYARIVK